MILQTDRLTLDELDAPRDEAFILELLNEPGFLANIGDRGVRNLEAAAGYILNVQASYSANGFGLWRMVETANGAAVGICGLVKRDGLDEPDVGYALLSRAEGRGYATEGARATLEYGRRALGLQRISAIVTPGNLGSIRVLEKVGLAAAGLIRLPGRDDHSAYFVWEA